jgi:FkbM family methyltransferase
VDDLMRIPEDLPGAQRTAAERWIRNQARTVPCYGSVVLARVLGKYSLYLDMNDVSLAPHLALDGYWEYWVTQFLASRVRSGWTVVDVGANVGYFSMLLADLVGARGKVRSYEPQQLHRLISKSAAVNGFADRLQVKGVAAGAEASTIELSVPGDYLGSTHLGEQREELKRLASYRSTTCLVERLDHHPPPDLVKIDAEGHEPQVLDGMSKWFDSGCRPDLVMEWDPSFYQGTDLLDRLTSLGYKLRKITTDATACDTNQDELCNCDNEMLWLTK